jgi:hypothetical protein
MTSQELADLGLTEEELSTMVQDLKGGMEADTIRFSSDVMTPERQTGLLAIRHRGSDGKLELSSIDVDTALFIRTTLSAYASLGSLPKTTGYAEAEAQVSSPKAEADDKKRLN